MSVKLLNESQRLFMHRREVGDRDRITVSDTILSCSYYDSMNAFNYDEKQIGEKVLFGREADMTIHGVTCTVG